MQNLQLLLGAVILAFTPTIGAGQEPVVLWQFETGVMSMDQFITVAPDGTVFTSDNEGLYAVSPAGEQVWFTPGVGGGRPIAQSGKVLYVGRTLGDGNPAIISAVDASDGSILWGYESPFTFSFLKVGPSLGPDGNIYAVQETDVEGEDGLGMFSLTPGGKLRWSNIGEPALWTLEATTNSPVVFTDDRLYIGLHTLASGPPIPRSFDFDGDQLWYGLDLNMRSHPRVGSDGSAVGAKGQTGMQAVSPDGDVLWSAIHPGSPNVVLRPTIGSDGVIYAGDYLGVELWALNPDGSTRWVGPNEGEQLTMLTISPDDATLIAGGGGAFGKPAWVRGYASEDGELLWHVDIPSEKGALSLVNSYDAAFSPDGGTVYLNIQFAGDVNEHGYLIAIRFNDGLCGDLNGDGAVDGSDLAIVLGSWNPISCAGCVADINGDGVVDGSDLALVLGTWGTCP